MRRCFRATMVAVRFLATGKNEVKTMKKKTSLILLILTVFILFLVGGYAYYNAEGGKVTLLYHEIRINAPPDKVWAVLADLEAVQHYNPAVIKAHYLSSMKEGVGASRYCDLKPKGWVKERVIGWEPKEAITMELYESEWPLKFMRWRTALRPDGAGTMVSQRMEYQVKFGVLGVAMDRLMMRSKLDKAIADVFVSMKSYIETGVAQPK